MSRMKPASRSVILIASISVAMTNASAQSLLWTHEGPNASARFGDSIDVIDDLDGDGARDVIVWASGGDCGGVRKGIAVVLSGKLGGVLFESCGIDMSNFGLDIAAGSDVNGDGIPDYIAGAISDDTVFLDAGRAAICSGVDGAILRYHFGTSLSLLYGRSVAWIDDLDGDLISDYCVGASDGLGLGRVDVFSGATGALLATLTGDGSPRNFGVSCADVGDVNLDGIHDIAVGDSGAGNNGTNSGSVYLFSGADWSQLYRIDGEFKDYQLGNAVDGLGDIDGDGCSDFIVGDRFFGYPKLLKGKFYVHSGKTGSLILAYEGVTSLGGCVAGLGDINLDGVPDYAVGESDFPYNQIGSVRLYSGWNGLELYRFEGDQQWANFGNSIAGGVDVTGDSKPEFLIGALTWSDGVDDVGRVSCYTLEKFFCTLEPEVVDELGYVDCQLAQTDPGKLAGVALVAVDGTPVFEFLVLTGADSLGRVFIDDAQIPTGTGGSTYTLRAYAIGFTGKLVSSTDVTLTVNP